MDKRRFTESLAASAAALNVFPALRADSAVAQLSAPGGLVSADKVHVEGHTLLSTFPRNGETWKVYEDLSTREGDLTFVSADNIARVLRKTAEAAFPEEGALPWTRPERHRHVGARASRREASCAWRSGRAGGSSGRSSHGLGSSWRPEFRPALAALINTNEQRRFEVVAGIG